MMNILDQVARSAFRAQHCQIHPTNTQEYFALRLAAKLGDSMAAPHYFELADRYSDAQLLAAYRRARAQPSGHLDLARRFHAELKQFGNSSGGEIARNRLVAIRVDRRSVTVAIFAGDHLEYAQTRQLSSAPEKALSSAVGFVSRILGKFSCPSAAIEVASTRHEIQRVLLQRAITRYLSEQATSIWEVSRTELLQAFGHPMLRCRQELREIISGVYPVLEEEPGRPWTQDAAALGLYVQTERLFSNLN
jgi:hypothetical protein